MVEGIISLAIGIIMVLFIAGFIAAANTATLSSTDVMVLGFVPTVALVLIIWGFVKLMKDAKFGI